MVYEPRQFKPSKKKRRRLGKQRERAKSQDFERKPRKQRFESRPKTEGEKLFLKEKPFMPDLTSVRILYHGNGDKTIVYKFEE